ncbi:hypothetical protein [Vibrio owensii]|uniref:hypothetical protein n=1 Tax=Vibrio owensii TaxID=696485 RepID=UPI00148B3AE5|nr:hypothetical protein [Vibrio owensii]NOI69619.1 hypothetical protein [Vibrio owensii]
MKKQGLINTFQTFDTEGSRVSTNKKLLNELSIQEAALAIFLNGWNAMDFDCLSHIRDEFNEKSWLGEEFEYDVIYQTVLTACCDGSLQIANASRLGIVTIPEHLVAIEIDDLVNWILKTKIKGENLVPSHLASICSFSELFQFYDKDLAATGYYKSATLKPTPGLALFFGEDISDDPQSKVALKRELKEAKREVSRLNRKLLKMEKFMDYKYPTEQSLLKCIAMFHDTTLNGTYDKKSMFRTNEEICLIFEEKYHGKLSYLGTRKLQEIFARIKSLQE